MKKQASLLKDFKKKITETPHFEMENPSFDPIQDEYSYIVAKLNLSENDLPKTVLAADFSTKDNECLLKDFDKGLFLGYKRSFNRKRCENCDILSKKIETLEKDLEKIKNVKDIYENKKSYSVKYDFVNYKTGEYYKESTDLLCWWCCHSFKTVPIGLPDKLIDQTFYMYGCFCSLNCVLSYNVDLGDYKVYSRTTLLNVIKQEIYGSDNCYSIQMAPPRHALKAFGGYLSIEDFRNNFYFFKKQYNVIKQPIYKTISINIEEEAEDDSLTKKIKMIRVVNSYTLQRTKPLLRSKNELNSIIEDSGQTGQL
ncbi:putative VLTF-2-like viral transcription factor [Namao virus]|nr:putative VLTF-2-like viral transcription factor [Namao virus]